MNFVLASKKGQELIFKQLDKILTEEGIKFLEKEFAFIINHSEKRKSVFIVNNYILGQFENLFTTTEAKKDLYWIGMRLGFLLKEKLNIGIESLSVIGEYFPLFFLWLYSGSACYKSNCSRRNCPGKSNFRFKR